MVIEHVLDELLVLAAHPLDVREILGAEHCPGDVFVLGQEDLELGGEDQNVFPFPQVLGKNPAVSQTQSGEACIDVSDAKPSPEKLPVQKLIVHEALPYATAEPIAKLQSGATRSVVNMS